MRFCILAVAFLASCAASPQIQLRSSSINCGNAMLDPSKDEVERFTLNFEPIDKKSTIIQTVKLPERGVFLKPIKCIVIRDNDIENTNRARVKNYGIGQNIVELELESAPGRKLSYTIDIITG